MRMRRLSPIVDEAAAEERKSCHGWMDGWVGDGYHTPPEYIPLDFIEYKSRYRISEGGC